MNYISFLKTENIFFYCNLIAKIFNKILQFLKIRIEYET